MNLKMLANYYLALIANEAKWNRVRDTERQIVEVECSIVKLEVDAHVVLSRGIRGTLAKHRQPCTPLEITQPAA